MSATVTTNEQFPAGTTEAQMDVEADLRLKAGAISSHYTGSETDGWILTTTWSVLEGR